MQTYGKAVGAALLTSVIKKRIKGDGDEDFSNLFRFEVLYTLFYAKWANDKPLYT